jgi:hypothetical protein
VIAIVYLFILMLIHLSGPRIVMQAIQFMNNFLIYGSMFCVKSPNSLLGTIGSTYSTSMQVVA